MLALNDLIQIDHSSSIEGPSSGGSVKGYSKLTQASVSTTEPNVELSMYFRQLLGHKSSPNFISYFSPLIH